MDILVVDTVVVVVVVDILDLDTVEDIPVGDNLGWGIPVVVAGDTAYRDCKD